jgi:hypothetical protein
VLPSLTKLEEFTYFDNFRLKDCITTDQSLKLLPKCNYPSTKAQYLQNRSQTEIGIP